MNAKFALLLLVGPGEEEIARGYDTIDSVCVYEKGNFRLVLVDDDLVGRNLVEKIAPQLGGSAVSILNPRKGRGIGWGGGSAAGVLGALKEVSNREDFGFVLKIDTDTLVISPFSVKIAQRFRELPNVGMLGYYRFNPQRVPDAEPNFVSSAPAFEKLLRQVSVWRRTPAGGPAIQIGCWGRYRYIRDTIRKALLNGYRLGEHCNGGGYAISRESVLRMNNQRLLEYPSAWLPTPCCEDAVVALSVRAVGLEIDDFNADGEPFGIKHRGLLDSPERLLERGFSIIHSVKDSRSDLTSQSRLEEEVRSFFREIRQRTLKKASTANE